MSVFFPDMFVLRIFCAILCSYFLVPMIFYEEGMAMVRFSTITMLFCSISLFLIISGAPTNGFGKEKSGEALFKLHCAACHPDGGNIINPKKTLHKKDREANGIKSKDDIIRLMRTPGPGMTSFNDKVLSDKSAKEIAEYILKDFK